MPSLGLFPAGLLLSCTCRGRSGQFRGRRLLSEIPGYPRKGRRWRDVPGCQEAPGRAEVQVGHAETRRLNNRFHANNPEPSSKSAVRNLLPLASGPPREIITASRKLLKCI